MRGGQQDHYQVVVGYPRDFESDSVSWEEVGEF